MKINFIASVTDPTLPKPEPASKHIPEWYRSIPRYADGKKIPHNERGKTPGTIKTCMPVLDAMTNGYLLFSGADVHIEQQENGRFYRWADHDLITFHSQRQLKGYPKLEEKIKLENVPKFSNPWIVQTPKGYSSLFVTPFHRDLPFTILPGIVDTDTYFAPVNFPFIPDANFEGFIPKGTPIAQVIPFKRDDWEMSVKSLEDFEDLRKKRFAASKILTTTFFDQYKKNFWKAKTYK